MHVATDDLGRSGTGFDFSNRPDPHLDALRGRVLAFAADLRGPGTRAGLFVARLPH